MISNISEDEFSLHLRHDWIFEQLRTNNLVKHICDSLFRSPKTASELKAELGYNRSLINKLIKHLISLSIIVVVRQSNPSNAGGREKKYFHLTNWIVERYR
jgi:predicted transcriptional regulator